MTGPIKYNDKIIPAYRQNGSRADGTKLQEPAGKVDPEVLAALREGRDKTQGLITKTTDKTDEGRSIIEKLMQEDEEGGKDFEEVGDQDQKGQDPSSNSGSGQPQQGSGQQQASMPQVPQSSAAALPTSSPETYTIPPELLKQLVQGMQDYQSENGGAPVSSSGDGGVDSDGEVTGPSHADNPAASEVEFDRGNNQPLSESEVKSVIDKALDLNGVPKDEDLRSKWTQILMYMADKESSYNPDAVNTYDSNAHGAPAADGNPFNCSRGIWQTIPTTFAANHIAGTSMNIYDPVASGAAAVHYILNGTVDGSGIGINGEGIEDFAATRGVGTGGYKGY